MTLSATDKCDIASLYGEGFSLRSIGEVIGCSHEAVRLVLRDEGVPVRARAGRGIVPARAKELLDDLMSVYGGQTTVAEIAEWLGLSGRSLECSIATLRQLGKVSLSDGVVSVTPGARTGSRRRNTDRDSRIMEMRQRGATYICIAESLGLTTGMVSGAVSRAKGAAA